ncbi:MAG: sigma-70 family RNA polymerase sigma factor [Actinomycetota bacterium]
MVGTADSPAQDGPAVTDADPTTVPTWEEVAEQYGRFLYSLAYRLTGNHQDAQDLVQEVLLRVRRGLAGYQPGNFKGWLSRITTNTFLDRVRKQNRRPTVALPEDPDRVLAGSPGADVELAARDLPDHLQDLLSDLQPEYRAAVVLADVLGYSYEEIADILDVPLGTVRSRIHRGRGRLRTALAS